MTSFPTCASVPLNMKYIHTRCGPHSYYDYLTVDGQEALGLASCRDGCHVSVHFDLDLREKDELLAATVVACLRRTLPALVEKCEREARDRVFPGDSTGEQV